MKKHAFTLVIIPNDNSLVREIKLSRFWLGSILTLIILLLSSVMFYSIGYYVNVVDQIKLESLARENRTLLDELTNISSQLKSITTKISSLSKEDDMLRVAADLPQIDPDIKRVGVGGPEYIDRGRLDNLSASSQALTKEALLGVDQLLRQARLQEASFVEIRRQLEGEKEKIAGLPTIQPTYGYITTGFGFRYHPFTGRREFHRGIDIANRIGAPIYVTADGTVELVGNQGYYGKYIVVDHGAGYKTLYGHLHETLAHEGQKVKRGEMIAKMGNSGRSTGPHLHYEVHCNDKVLSPTLFFYGNESLAAGR
jgi:murein DD-endopeptidase MepM/ murein hydrolase activator NlpD